MQQRKAFIDEYLKKERSVSEPCPRFEVSRKTAYQWIDRFPAGGALVDRSRRSHTGPRAIAAALEDAIVEARKVRPIGDPKCSAPRRLWPTPARIYRR
jgi:putative transposase